MAPSEHATTRRVACWCPSGQKLILVAVHYEALRLDRLYTYVVVTQGSITTSVHHRAESCHKYHKALLHARHKQASVL